MNRATQSEVMSVERIERDAWLDLYDAAPSAYAALQGMKRARLGPIGLLACPTIPTSEFNRGFCIGVDAAAGETALDEALAWLRKHGSSNAVLQFPPAAQTEATQAWLRRVGFEKRGAGWAKFRRNPSSSLPATKAGRPAPEVRLVGPDEAEAFGRVVQAGFGLPLHSATWFTALVGRPRWQLYLAYHGDIPVASGALYLDGGWGWMGIDATLSDYRRRGAQTALIARRVTDVAGADLRGLTAETGQPQPGAEAQYASYSNYRRAGFEPLYVRDNYR